jgi:peptide deformylase
MNGTMDILKYGNSVLRQKAGAIEEIDNDLRDLARRMLEVVKELGALGLAAPQVGVSRRMFVARIPDNPPEDMVMINPVVVETGGVWEFEEGCLSVPGISGNIVRPMDIVVEGMSLDGQTFRRKYTDLPARIIQHETDHLNGILFIDRLNIAKRAIIKSKLRKMAKGSKG